MISLASEPTSLMVVESAKAGAKEHLEEDRLKTLKNTANIWNALQKHKSVETENALPAIQRMGIAPGQLRCICLLPIQATISISLLSRNLMGVQWLTPFVPPLSLSNCLSTPHARKCAATCEPCWRYAVRSSQ